MLWIKMILYCEPRINLLLRETDTVPFQLYQSTTTLPSTTFFNIVGCRASTGKY
jgi:hypothetical protein